MSPCPAIQEKQLWAAQQSSISFVFKEGSSTLKPANSKEEKGFEKKKKHALFRDSLGELGMQAAPLKADKVRQFLFCVGG